MSVPAATRRRVSATSSGLGDGLPLGCTWAHDHGGGIREQRGGKHGAGFNRDRIQTATAHLVVGHHLSPRRQKHEAKDLGGFLTEHALQECCRALRARQRLSEQDRLARVIGLDGVPDREFAKHRGRVIHRRVLLIWARGACLHDQGTDTRTRGRARPTPTGGLTRCGGRDQAARLARAG